MSKRSILHIMRKNIYNNILNHSGSPPLCKICILENEKIVETDKKIDAEIKVGQEYVHKNTRLHRYGAFYCVDHAKEKNLL